MKNFYTQKNIVLAFIFSFFFFSFNAIAQVGIGTIDPNPNALLELDASATPGGLLLPRMALTAINNINPLLGPVAELEGMTVYNTATAGTGVNRVTPGFYYHDGSTWVRISEGSGPNSNWRLRGNAGTVAGTDFLGTTDNIALQFKTNDFSRFEITSGTTQAHSGRLRAFTNGTAAAPIYSWTSATNMGMYRVGDDSILGFSTAGTERMRIAANGNVGIGANNPSERLEVTGNLRLHGAFMPGNQAGTTDKILLSKGANTAPSWGPGFLNTDQISNIGKYYVTNINISAQSSLTLTTTDTDMTRDTALAYNFVGPLPLGPDYGKDLYIMAEARAGTIVFHIRNNSNYNLSNFQIAYTAFYH